MRHRHLLFLLMFLTACHQTEDVNHLPVAQRMERNTNAWNKQMVDSAVAMLHNGDLVMRRGIDASSFLLSQMNLKNKTYSHCGIVLIENGRPYVYHSIGGEDNPNARLRRDPAAFFFSPRNNLCFGIARYGLDSVQKDSLAAAVHDYYKQGKMFDLNFDLDTDDRLYCAEFVYKALVRATGDKSYIRLSNYMGFKFVGIDDLYMGPHSRVVWEVKYK